jgi:hypothetical protein
MASRPIQPPRTPSGKSDRLNKKVEALNKRWHLGIQTRGGDWTPSKRPLSPAELCFEKIKCLFWSSELQLDSLLLEEFPRQALLTSSTNHLSLLLELLEAALPAKTRPRVRNEGSGAKIRMFLNEDHPQLEGQLKTTAELNKINNNNNNVQEEVSGSRVKRSIFVHGQTERLERLAADEELERSSRGISEHPLRVRSLQVRHTTPEADTEEEGDFVTPPESPSRDAIQRQAQRQSPGMSATNGREGRRKRISDGDNISPSKRRVSESTTTTESAYHSVNFSIKPPVTLNDSFRSTSTRIESAMTSFSSTPGPSGLAGRGFESANTSFGSEMADMSEVVSKDEAGHPLSNVYGSSMPSLPPNLGNIITNQSFDRPVSNFTQPPKSNSIRSVGKISTETSEPISIETRNMMIDIAAQAEEQASLPYEEHPVFREMFQGLSPTTTTLDDRNVESPPPLRRHGSEHWRLKSLPKEDLFVNESDEPAYIPKLSFRARFECARVALAFGLSVHDLASESVVGITEYADLWSYFNRCAEEKGFTLPKRSSDKAWEDSPRCEYVNLKARLTINYESNSRQPLFKLHIEPIEWDNPCRFQYAYGGDRFLYLFLPDLELRNDLKQHQEFLIPRLLEWMNGVKNFLGRKWEVIHVEPMKPKSKQQRKERKFSYRIVLFATTGYDILPKLADSPYSRFTKCVEPSSRPETTRNELVDWFMPLQKNAYQSFCKAFARLDLGNLD